MTKISTHYDGCEASHPECKKALGLQTTTSGDTSRVAYPQGATHTPGPWHVSTTGIVTNEGQVAVLAPDKELGKRRIALVDLQRADVKARERWQVDDPEREANARLIAQSPALLAACSEAHSIFCDLANWVECLRVNGQLLEPDASRIKRLIGNGLQITRDAELNTLAAEGSDRP